LAPPNKEDIKFGLAGACVAGVGVEVGVGVGVDVPYGFESGNVALVDTLIDGLKLKSVLSFLRKMSDKSVVSFKKNGFAEVVVGFDFVTENNGCCAAVLDGNDGAFAGCDARADSENGSDLVFVGSTSNDKSSIGTTLSGGVPPTLAVVSRVISILFSVVVDPLLVGEALPDLLLIIFTVFNPLLAASEDLSKLISLSPFIRCICF